MKIIYEYKTELQELFSKLAGANQLAPAQVRAPGPEWSVVKAEVIQVGGQDPNGRPVNVPMLWLLWVRETHKTKTEMSEFLLGNIRGPGSD
jgi:hypothetical protein